MASIAPSSADGASPKEPEIAELMATEKAPNPADAMLPAAGERPSKLSELRRLLVRALHLDSVTKKQRQERDVERYYRRQRRFLDALDEDKGLVRTFEINKLYRRKSSIEEDSASDASFNEDDAAGGGDEKQLRLELIDKRLAFATFLVNLCLLIAKVVASALSGSLSVISSAVDSVVDLTSGAVIWLSSRAIRRRNRYKYPRGRTRLEPLALIIVSVVMGVASFQIILQSAQAMIGASKAQAKVNASKDVGCKPDVEWKPDVGWPTITIMCVTIVVKFALVVVCFMFKSANSRVLAQDHRNDCISNSLAIACAYAGEHIWYYIDPIGAILVSVYIISSWIRTGLQQAAILTGRAASPDHINRILAICIDHNEKIKCIEQMAVYHFGTKYLVEVHVVMDAHVTVQEAHDIVEPLQKKIEHLPYVERAFTHIDYDAHHAISPEDSVGY